MKDKEWLWKMFQINGSQKDMAAKTTSHPRLYPALDRGKCYNAYYC